MSISTLQSISSEIIRNSVNKTMPEVVEKQEVSSFSEILAEACGKSVTVISKDDSFLFRKTVRKENLLITENVVVTEKNDIDFESVAPYLMDFKVKKV